MVNYIINLILPRKCIVCSTLLSDKEKYICDECLVELPLTYFWDWRNNPAEVKLWGRTYIEKVYSLFFYSHENNYHNILFKIKYHHKKKLGIYIGELLGEKIKDKTTDIDFIVPVPIHKRKKRKRGYNQSEIIARGVSNIIHKPVKTTILHKVKYTKSQTKVSMEGKWQNVSNTFSVNNKNISPGHHILLVDDVLTSGATIEACYNELSTIEGIKVSVATIAYVE